MTTQTPEHFTVLEAVYKDDLLGLDSQARNYAGAGYAAVLKAEGEE